MPDGRSRAHPLPPRSVIGILGGGQLGKMLASAASALGFRTHVYSAEAGPAFYVATAHSPPQQRRRRPLPGAVHARIPSPHGPTATRLRDESQHVRLEQRKGVGIVEITLLLESKANLLQLITFRVGVVRQNRNVNRSCVRCSDRVGCGRWVTILQLEQQSDVRPLRSEGVGFAGVLDHAVSDVQRAGEADGGGERHSNPIRDADERRRVCVPAIVRLGVQERLIPIAFDPQRIAVRITVVGQHFFVQHLEVTRAELVRALPHTKDKRPIIDRHWRSILLSRISGLAVGDRRRNHPHRNGRTQGAPQPSP